MNVQVADTRVVGATDPYTELWVTVKPRENAHPPRRHALRLATTTQNTGRLQIQSLRRSRSSPSRSRTSATR